MREILPEIERWMGQGKRIALATVVRTWASAPRLPGAKMAVSEAGEMAGSVSGGCVETAVVEQALAILKGDPPTTLSFGVADEQAWEVGLACGGQIEVFVEPLGPLGRSSSGRSSPLDALRQTVAQERPALRAVVIRGPDALLGRSLVFLDDGDSLGEVDPAIDELVRQHALAALASGETVGEVYPFQSGEIEIFFDPHLPPPTLVIVGGVHIAMTLSRLAKLLGFRVVVVDPRRRFASPERFPEADALLPMWPDEGLRKAGLTPSTAVAVLSHDPKLDDPALMAALRSPAGYVGALGSRRTHSLRRRRLLEAGLTEAELDRLHAPIGLDLGRGSPEEIALSILAEVVVSRAKERRPIS